MTAPTVSDTLSGTARTNPIRKSFCKAEKKTLGREIQFTIYTLKMDGKYLLSRKGTNLVLELTGDVVRISGPDGIRTLPPTDNPKARFDAELLAKLKDGWEIADVQTDSSRVEAEHYARQQERENTPHVGRCIPHDGALVIDIDPDCKVESLTRELAAEVLRSAGCAETKGLYINEMMQRKFDADGMTWYSTIEPWCAAIGAVGAPACKQLVIDTTEQSMVTQASVYCGDITAMLNNAPALEQVYVAGHATVSTLELPYLREFRFIGEGLPASTITAVLRGRAPKLETLALGLGYDEFTNGNALDALIAGLNEADLPSLRRLYIATGLFRRNPAQLIARLAASRLVKQLELLFLDTGPSDDQEVVDALVTCAPSLQHLKQFAVSHSVTEDFTDEERACIRSALPNFEVIDLRDAVDDPFGPHAHSWLSYPN